jgi:hypothetical protein
MPFSVSHVDLIGSGVIRVTFTQIPYIYSDTTLTDASNVSNYTLAGPGVIDIGTVLPVSADPYSVDLFLSSPLQDGDSWTLNVASTLIDVSQGVIYGTLAWPVTGKPFASSVILGGANNETAEHLLRKNINPLLSGKVWNALISAIATGEQANWNNATAAFDQLYVSSASDKYLLQRGSDNGVRQPKNVGLSDDLFRQYVLQIKNRQLSIAALNEMIEVFYGPASVRGDSISTAYEPYVLGDGYDLSLTIDGLEDATVIFSSDDFEDISAATALEVSVALNKYFENHLFDAFALPYLDVSTNQYQVQILSSSLGTGSSVQITGGRAQSILWFDTRLVLLSGVDPLPTWNISLIPATNRVRFTTSTSPTQLNVASLHVGDYVTIFGSEFNASNRGSFPVLDVSRTLGPLVQYFEIENLLGVAEVIVQISALSIQYFRPTTKDIYSESVNTAAFAIQTIDEKIDIVLPATSQAISRQALSGAYLQDNTAYNLSAGTRTGRWGGESFTLTTSVAPTESGGIQAIFPSVKGTLTPPSTTAGVSGNIGYSPVSFWSQIDNSGTSMTSSTVVRLTDGSIHFIGGIATGLVVKNQIDYFTVTGETFTANGGLRYQYAWASKAMTTEHAFCGATAIFGNYNTSRNVYDGTQILITGGVGLALTAIATCEIWNPFLNTTTAVASLGTGRTGHCQITLQNGKVLVMGGKNAAGTVIGTCEIYDPYLNTWTATGSLVAPRYLAHAELLNDGRVLIFGGTASPYNDVLTEVYSVGGGTWSVVGGRLVDTGSTVIGPTYKLSDGRVLTIGGKSKRIGSSDSLASNYGCEIFDPTLNYWIPGPALLPITGTFDPNSIVGAHIESDGAEVVPGITESNYERIIVWFTGISAPTVRSCQYIDIRTPPNEVGSETFVWKKGPDLNTVAANLALAQASWVAGNLIIYTKGVSAGGGLTTASAYALIVNCDTWGTPALSSGPIPVSVSGSTVTINSINRGKAQDYCSYDPSSQIQFLSAGGGDGIPGPYLWDNESGAYISDPSIPTTVALLAGNSYNVVNLASTANFPSSGLLMFNFGKSNAVYPVPYSHVISGTQLRIDGSFVFPYTVDVGSEACLINLEGFPYPDDGYPLGSFYLTDSPAGRVAAQGALDRIVAGGIEVDATIVYPGDMGLGGAGFPTQGTGKLSDIVEIFAGSGDDVDDA